ncbi:Lrp/AsnC family transcriptional regulator [Niveispirillum cyanobacteriorum]|uniref:Transcriptional regulator n=1 Tax=Niveispirillum cyanobacteriorum TaxID=1612173 RepID=A0A2K9NIB5_9PROT|nr:Lrp/AsnC family transcriptional regulator [Niveispirillum cyanobacteriorum]AUN32837.1 transcriptional regulator [Niveispirillum cyanobacteriorum]GGE74759.1 ArsR family transcriptional regulator [Niveispirillum cyanobacteriorum]
MDQIDRKILAALQSDASGSVAEIAERAGVSQTPAWRRIKRLEDEGIIRKRVALLDPAKLNLGLTGFILIRTATHSEEWLQKFSEGVSRIPEVIELHRMSGDIDYLVKFMVDSIAGYDALYKRLIKVANLSDVSAGFSMECLKYTTELPLDYVKG